MQFSNCWNTRGLVFPNTMDKWKHEKVCQFYIPGVWDVRSDVYEIHLDQDNLSFTNFEVHWTKKAIWQNLNLHDEEVCLTSLLNPSVPYLSYPKIPIKHFKECNYTSIYVKRVSVRNWWRGRHEALVTEWPSHISQSVKTWAQLRELEQTTSSVRELRMA